jgi:ectoine hydroxylase-related dioxygenase (phytanoyl-CoA dioxygenase family)
MQHFADPEQLRDSYHSAGFVFVEDFLSRPELDALEQSINEIFSQFARSGEARDDVCSRLDREDQEQLYHINQMIRMLPELHALESSLKAIVTALFPTHDTALTLTTNILIGLPEDERLAYDWHQESSYLPTTEGFINFWYPLFADSTTENGAMGLLKGTHELGPLSFDRDRVEENARTNHIPENIEAIEDSHEEVRTELGRGSVVGFHPDMIHRSGSNLTGSVRFTGVTRMAPIDEIASRAGDFAELY